MVYNRSMDIPITQSEAWRILQEELKERTFFKEDKDYQYLAIVKHTPAGNYLYLPYGPVAQNPDGMKAALKALKDLAKTNHCIFIRIEPQLPDKNQYLPITAKKVKDISPADTWVLDITPDKSILTAGFSQGTRTRYNTYSKKGLIVEKTKDVSEIKHLVDLQAKLFKTKHLTAYDADYLKAELRQPFATLYLVKYDKKSDLTREPANLQTGAGNYPADRQVLAASLFFDYEDTRYYMQSAADQEYRRLPATVALLTSAIFDAKEQGIKRFDFWGIAPEGAPADHPWKGFTEFKQSFGGKAVHYAGTYDIILNPLKYRLYTSLRNIKRRTK